MLIRHKIIVWFIGLTGFLLFLFSFYIYFAFVNSRKSTFQERIRNKALATKEIYDQHDVIAEKIITSIPEQSEYVFDENYALIFAINDLHDYEFDREFLRSVTAKKEIYFEYIKKGGNGLKEGYAFSFVTNSKLRIIIIVAFDKSGYEQISSLKYILIFGNIFFLILIGISGYFFARNIFKPVSELVLQVEAEQADNLDYRLNYQNPTDEIGIVTLSFNKILDRIQSLVESQKRFIAFASHELRTPLAAISGILETSVNYDHEVEVTKNSMRAALKELHRAKDLVNGLLQLAKIESTQEKIEMQNVNLVDLLIDAISFFKLKQPLQELSLDVDQRFSADNYIELNGNAYLLQTALLNVIDNASKYSALKKIGITLTVATRDRILIRITDSGIGIEEADMKHLMAPMFRGKNTTGIEGFGLGLALTSGIIALHHGDILIKNNSGEGTTTEIFLPARITKNS